MEQLTSLVQELWLLTVIVWVVVEAVKRTKKVPKKYFALGALAVGVVVAILFPGYVWVDGLLAGAVASGLYAAGKDSFFSN